MLPQIVIVLFVLICILIIKIKEFIEKNSDTILISLCVIILAIWMILQCKSIYSKYKKIKLKNKRCALLRECPAYTLLYQFSPKDTGQSKVK